MKALITGASSGIGKAFAEALASQGYSLVLVARRTENLQALQKHLTDKYKTKVEYIAQDISTSDGVNAIFSQATDIDLLINNAGYGVIGDFLETSLEKEAGMIDLNIKTLYLLTKKYALAMAKRQSGGIINIASAAAFQPVPYMAAYSATKAFVLSFTDAISYEMRNSGVHIMTLCPGATNTEFFAVADPKGGTKNIKGMSLMSPEEVVKQCLQGYKNKRRVCIAGAANAFLVFTGRFTPRNVLLNVVGKMMKK